jgi:RHS repeat-associated protein
MTFDCAFVDGDCATEPQLSTTIRGLDGKVLRIYNQPFGGAWDWERDYVYRDGQLLASVETAAGGGEDTVHFHLDHLGSPRQVTDEFGAQAAFHTYYPFGEEATDPSQDDVELRFTGHERDDNGGGAGVLDYLDYMHARYCAPKLGRFLSPDPIGAGPNRPQGWNRYAYALDNPLKWVDPAGETVSFAHLNEGEREILLEELNEFTGNTYDVNDSLELALLEVGASSSETATSFLNDAIADDRVFEVMSVAGRNEGPLGEVRLNFSSFDDIDYRKVDPTTFNLGSTFVHELFHATSGIQDWAGYPGNVINLSDFTWRGPAVEFVNQIRADRGLPQRASHLAGKGMRGRSKLSFDHVNPKKPEKIYYVRRGIYWK